MKILFIVGDLESGGAERVVSTLANSFSNENSVEVLMISAQTDETFYKVNSNIKLKPLLAKNPKLSLFKKIRKIRGEIVSFDPDVVISFLNYVIIYSWLALKKIKKKKNIKFVVSERNDPNNVPATFLFRAIRNKIFSKADGCVFQTHDARDYFKRIQSCVIIPNPVYIDRKTIFDYKNTSRDKTILIVGSTKKEKNRKLAYRAFKDFNVDFPDYKMAVIGAKPLKNEITLIKRLKLENKIDFVGKDNSWHQKYQSAVMFILPSNFEGMPNALLEAAAIQIPCISTNCPIGGPKEILEDGKNGILVKVNDYKNLANQMKELAKSKDLQDHYSNQCANISKKYDCQNISKLWLNYIKSLI